VTTTAEVTEPTVRNQRESLDIIASAMIANANALQEINANLDRIAAMMQAFAAMPRASAQPFMPPPMPPSATPVGAPAGSPFSASPQPTSPWPAAPASPGFMRSAKRFGQ